ncbi:hypothetical protein OS175_07150 [Marinicella sp. S1101]|uniref:hypothetical protein n=1 Tax=Marinicella marina TaxID=2996016 RepID=UPI0022608BD2|nr:hypothetical protein [Marinicella marina]MCX7553650.1 hypothetical protein [Marinicella marina]MDJ1140274.1 hypothetical protein [Marinicella marina]
MKLLIKLKKTSGKALMLLFLACSMTHVAAQETKTDQQIKAAVEVFFEAYLDTYNQRFGHPEKAPAFIASMSALIHQPFLMTPPNTPPFQPKDKAQMTRVFDGFVSMLEQKGAIKLKWKNVSLKVLSQHKVLANNVGYAIDAEGKEVYKTASVYLLVQVDGQWQIALFSPYELSREWSFN